MYHKEASRNCVQINQKNGTPIINRSSFRNNMECSWYLAVRALLPMHTNVRTLRKGCAKNKRPYSSIFSSAVTSKSDRFEIRMRRHEASSHPAILSRICKCMYIYIYISVYMHLICDWNMKNMINIYLNYLSKILDAVRYRHTSKKIITWPWRQNVLRPFGWWTSLLWTWCYIQRLEDNIMKIPLGFWIQVIFILIFRFFLLETTYTQSEVNPSQLDMVFLHLDFTRKRSNAQLHLVCF